MASVGISNRFDLLDDERPVKAKAPAPVAAPAAVKPTPKKEGNNNRKDRGNKPRRDGDDNRRGGRGGRGRGRGRGGPRRDGDGERSVRQPRRENDRRSASGRNNDRSEKRQGGGQYNWGTKEEVITPEDTQVPVAETLAVEQQETSKAAEEPVEPEEEDNTMTYEQMLAKRAANAVDSDRKSGRQVKNDEGNWADAEFVDHQKHLDAVSSDEEEEQQQKNRKALSFDEFLSTKANRRGGRGRGARGDRADRSARGGRGDRSVKLDDESAFPALGQA